MTKSELKNFLRKWNELNKIYKKYYKKNSISFPEPLQKNVLMSLYDSKLVLVDEKSSYDFKGNIELKSSTKDGGGCTPFSERQNECSRIIYVEIGEHFDVYEISDVDVCKINKLISDGNTNISLNKYKKNAKKVRII